MTQEQGSNFLENAPDMIIIIIIGLCNYSTPQDWYTLGTEPQHPALGCYEFAPVSNIAQLALVAMNSHQSRLAHLLSLIIMFL